MKVKEIILSKVAISLFSVTTLVALIFAENIYGYYRFKLHCVTDGGLKVYEKLERNTGWLADDIHSARSLASFQDVGFVRYPDRKEKDTFYDIHYIGGDLGRKSSYESRNSDINIEVRYQWRTISKAIPDEIRLQHSRIEVTDIRSKKLLLEYDRYSYSFFNRKNTLLGAPSGGSCFRSESTNAIRISFKDN